MQNVKTLGILILLYLGLCVFIFFYQKNLIFFPSKKMANMPSNMQIEEVFFTTKDKIKLHAWYLNNNSNQTVLFFHGNAGNLSYRRNQLETFNKLKLNALIFDYRGYGKSKGNIKIEQDLYTDANAAYDYLLTIKKVNPKDLIIWGRSLGSAVALNLAQHKKVAALIIESPFYSIDEMARKQYWFLPTKWLARFHFRNDEKIKNISSKILLIHGKNDEIIPFQQGKKLFNIAPQPKEFLTISGSHNYGVMDSYDLYFTTIKNFLNLNNDKKALN